MSGARPGARGAAWLLVAVLTALLGGPAAAAPPSSSAGSAADRPGRADTQPTTGLAVSIDTISPAYLTPGVQQNVRGVITNLDDHVWRDLQVYLVMSPSPLASREELAAALASPATAYSGNRVFDPGLYLNLGSLQPGESTSYDLSVPFGRLGLLSRAPGVYWIGVHVIATDADGFRNAAVATGRARSLIPLMPSKVETPVGLALVWPFQAPVQRATDGTYLNADTLTGEVSEGGRLRRMLDMATAAGDVPVTLVIDPGVLDALANIAAGTACRVASQTPGPVASTPTEPDATPSPQELVPDETPQQGSAREFVSDLLTVARSQPVWVQGFGRPDLAALASRRGSSLDNAVDNATAASLETFGLSGRRVYLPTQDVDAETLSRLPADTVALVSADQLAGWQLPDGPVTPVQGTDPPVDVLVSDRTLTDGGPAPGPTDAALQVRQRLLSESALLSLEATAIGISNPGMIFVASPSWDPGPTWPSSGFFTAFDAPWLQMTTPESQLTQAAGIPATALAPAHAASPTLPSGLLDTAADMVRRARILRAVTQQDPTLPSCSDQAVAAAVSEYWRSDPDTGEAIAGDALRDLGKQLNLVTVDGPDFVTLSSDSGRFPITITNDLDRPVRVGVRITADDGSMTFDDIGPVDLRRNDSTTFTVRTTASDVGVIAVKATLTTPTGRPFGKPATFSLRTSAVGVIVWIALGAAAVLVGLAVVRSLRRRDRGGARRSEPAPPPLRTSP